MKILVTGSSGLIGSDVSSRLRNVGSKVVTMDTRIHPKTKEKPDFGNILDSNQLNEAVRDVDGIVYLAAISRVVDARKALN